LGVRLYLHTSWFPVYGLLVWASESRYAVSHPDLPVAERILMALITAVCFFACLVLHELSHAVVARRFGVRVEGITLFLLGGVAQIDGEVPSASQEFAVALAGPAVSLVLACGFASLYVGGSDPGALRAVLSSLAVANLGLALFNLIPGLPLDGGRLLRAAVWRTSGSFERGTKVALAGGRMLAAALIVIGVAALLTGHAAGLWYVPMGAFLALMARASARGGAPAPRAALASGRGTGSG
jgi:Zn-dependent protease